MDIKFIVFGNNINIFGYGYFFLKWRMVNVISIFVYGSRNSISVLGL